MVAGLLEKKKKIVLAAPLAADMLPAALLSLFFCAR